MSSPIDMAFDSNDDEPTKFIDTEPMDVVEQDAIKRTTDLQVSLVQLRTKNSVLRVAQASDYKLETTMCELNTAQAFILAMFDALYNKNYDMCTILLDLAPRVEQLRSAYLEMWLREDYNFKYDVVRKVLTYLDTADLEVPGHILRVFAGLTERYGLFLDDEPTEDIQNDNNNPYNNELHLQASRDIPGSTRASSDELSMSKRVLGLPPDASVQEVRTHACATNREGYTLIHRFAEAGQVQGVEELLSINVPFDLKGPGGALPIHMAVECGQLQVMPVLLRAGCSMNVARDDGNTPAHLAASIGGIETLGWLVDHGANITTKNRKGQTPLHIAAASGFADTLATLLSLMAEQRRLEGTRLGAIPRGKGAVDPRDAEGCTPLHLAARANNLEAIRVLLDHNADYKLLNNEGHSPLTEAVLWGANEAEKLLQGIKEFDRGQHSR